MSTASSGLMFNPSGSGWFWAHLTGGKEVLAKTGDLGEALDRQIRLLSRPRPDMQPAAFGGFAISGSGFENLDAIDGCAQSRAGRGCYNLSPGASFTDLISGRR